MATGWALAEALEGMTQLTVLNLSSCSIGVNQASCLAHTLQQLTGLQNL